MDIKVLTRVRALLAKAESTTYPEEAEAFTAKAMQLMASHGITDAMLAAAGQRDDHISEDKIKLTDPYSFEKSQLLASICDALRCRVVFGTLGRRVLYCNVTGFHTDRERVELLFTSLLLQATTQIAQITHGIHVTTIVARRSWWAGFSYQVQIRLTQAEAQAVSDYNTNHAGSHAELVLVDRRTQVDRWYEQAHQKLPELKSQQSIDSESFLHGMAAGMRADLGNGGLGARPSTVGLPS